MYRTFFRAHGPSEVLTEAARADEPGSRFRTGKGCGGAGSSGTGRNSSLLFSAVRKQRKEVETMKQKTTVFTEIEPILAAEYGEGQKTLILEYAQTRFRKLCDRNDNQSRAVQAHTVARIYPCVALYVALQCVGISKADAVAFLDRSWSQMAEKDAEAIRRLLKIPGLYRLMPRMFRWMTVHNFGAKAGFQAKFYPTDSGRCKFDMTRCLYCEECRRLGCPELIVCFCHTDDVTDGHMHPKLIWNRTKIMGDGADCCDFDLYIHEAGKTGD